MSKDRIAREEVTPARRTPEDVGDRPRATDASGRMAMVMKAWNHRSKDPWKWEHVLAMLREFTKRIPDEPHHARRRIVGKTEITIMPGTD